MCDRIKSAARARYRPTSQWPQTRIPLCVGSPPSCLTASVVSSSSPPPAQCSLLPVLSAHADGMSFLSVSPIPLITAAAITCLGDDVRYDVVKPVLECCSADTLLRLEQSSPVRSSRFITTPPSHPPCSILNKTPQARPHSAPGSPPFASNLTSSDLWERLCFKSYPLLAEQLARSVDEQPESWRDQYFVCSRPT